MCLTQRERGGGGGIERKGKPEMAKKEGRQRENRNINCWKNERNGHRVMGREEGGEG